MKNRKGILNWKVNLCLLCHCEAFVSPAARFHDGIPPVEDIIS